MDKKSLLGIKLFGDYYFLHQFYLLYAQFNNPLYYKIGLYE